MSVSGPRAEHCQDSTPPAPCSRDTGVASSRPDTVRQARPPAREPNRLGGPPRSHMPGWGWGGTKGTGEVRWHLGDTGHTQAGAVVRARMASLGLSRCW